MRAVVLEDPGHLAVVDRPEPHAPAPDEVLVATRRVGLCGTDYHAYAGNQNFFSYPRVLGHELAVEVLEVGRDVTNVSAGDCCAVLPYLPCGECISCRNGRTNCCQRLQVLGVTTDGGMRERFTVASSALFGRPALDLDALALIETLGIGYHAVQRSGVQPGQFALVVGGGPIGLATCQVLLAAGARVALTDTSPDRLSRAAAMMPVHALAAGGGLDERLREADLGRLPTLVFDATGNRNSMEHSLTLVEFTGTLVLVGHTTSGLTFDNPTLHRREITVVTSRNALASEWEPLLDLVEAGTIGATPWITDRTDLSDVVTDLPRWASAAGTMLKALVQIDAESVAR